jgi:hypothetical protein
LKRNRISLSSRSDPIATTTTTATTQPPIVYVVVIVAAAASGNHHSGMIVLAGRHDLLANNAISRRRFWTIGAMRLFWQQQMEQ